MEIEKWETDERMQSVLVAMLQVAHGQRAVLTSNREIRELAGLPFYHVTSTLKKLRREGVIAMTTSWRGTQVTFLRKLHIDQRETADLQR